MPKATTKPRTEPASLSKNGTFSASSNNSTNSKEQTYEPRTELEKEIHGKFHKYQSDGFKWLKLTHRACWKGYDITPHKKVSVKKAAGPRILILLDLKQPFDRQWPSNLPPGTLKDLGQLEHRRIITPKPPEATIGKRVGSTASVGSKTAAFQPGQAPLPW